jgi:hypothetical protein
MRERGGDERRIERGGDMIKRELSPKIPTPSHLEAIFCDAVK